MATTASVVETQLERLRTDGFCLVENVIPKAEIPRIRENVHAAISKNSRSPFPREGCSNLLRFNQDIAPYFTDKRVVAVVEGALGPKYRVSYVTGYVTGPGRDRDIWHSDWPFNQRNSVHIPAPYPDFCAHLTTFFMLTDFRPENGATFLVPGSHKKGDHPRPGGEHGDWMESKEGEVRLLGKAGDIGICDSRLWHAVSPNVTNESRVVVVVRFASWWLNLNPTRRETAERTLMTMPDSFDSVVEDLPRETYDGLPHDVKPLVKHLLPYGQQVI